MWRVLLLPRCPAVIANIVLRPALRTDTSTLQCQQSGFSNMKPTALESNVAMASCVEVTHDGLMIPRTVTMASNGKLTASGSQHFPEKKRDKTSDRDTAEVGSDLLGSGLASPIAAESKPAR